ncbi:unnamed protein product [Mycena citricolor]|uniref:Uncharacterized protein n=1 Tax=Mycena citricolor TaxID=2018698 RepID=A0AAD2K7H3_9AGAR|nr:unnamed protein product [Mycena citricolor]
MRSTSSISPRHGRSRTRAQLPTQEAMYLRCREAGARRSACNYVPFSSATCGPAEARRAQTPAGDFLVTYSMLTACPGFRIRSVAVRVGVGLGVQYAQCAADALEQVRSAFALLKRSRDLPPALHTSPTESRRREDIWNPAASRTGNGSPMRLRGLVISARTRSWR